MELEQEPHNKDIDLMLKEPKVISHSPPSPFLELVLTKQGDIALVDNDLVMDVYNISFDKLHNGIIQVWRKKFSNDHSLPTFIKERVIVLDTRKCIASLAERRFTYAGETSSNVKYLMTENEKLEKDLQATRKEAEKP